MKNNLFRYLLFVVFIFSGTANFAQKNIKINHNTFGAIKARQIGPATMSGRIAALDACDEDPRLIYIGAASGGVWKSKNAGTTFKPVFDKYVQSIGAICMDQRNPDTVWVGTGEPWTRNSVSVGDGVYKTVDGGESWKHVGLKETERIGRIVTDPTNSDIVYIAALGHLWGPNKERGVFKTSDGGKTWEKILFIDENTGCSDLAIDSKEPNTIYAAMWQFRRKAYSFNSGGPGSGLYKSTDGGKTWKKLTKDLPSGTLGRICISVSPVDNNIVYAIIESKKTALYRSRDKGETWKEMNKTRIINERPFYFSNIQADPIDTNRVYKPGFRLSVSKNGGKNFGSTSIQRSAYHPDLHALYIGKKDNKLLYLGTDGGFYVSRDQGNTWAKARNLPISQFYHVSADMQSPYNVYGGLQDNGSWYGPSKSPGGISNADWKGVGFGDGFCMHADPKDNNIVYWQYQGGNIARAYLKTNEFKSIKPYKSKDTKDLRFNWNTPVVFGHDGNRMYVGAQYLYVTENKGDTWIRISPDLTTDDANKQKQEESGGLTIDNSTAENHCTIFTISESPMDKNIIWVGTDDGNLQLTTDGGKNWTNVSPNIPNLPKNNWCSFVEAGHFEKGTAYATFDGHRNSDMTAYVYKTTDFGKTWISLIDKNLQSYAHIIREDLINSELLFLGTEAGLFVSIDGGKQWSQFKENLPPVSIRDMVIHKREHDLILGTHGRGIFIIDDITPLRELKKEILSEELVFLKSRDYIIDDLGMVQSFGGDDEFTGPNPPEAAVISYYMSKRHIFGDMFIEIYNKEGEKIQKLAAGKRKGVNKVLWYVRRKPPKVPASPQLAGFAMQGPTYPAGEYMVKVVKEDKTFESKINLKLNPESPHSEEDRNIRQKTLTQAYDLLENLAFIDKQVIDIRDQAEKQSEKTSKKINKRLLSLSNDMENLHKKLVATKEGNITGEKQLREKIATLYGYILFYKGKPTDSQIARVNDIEKEVNFINDKLQNTIQTEVEQVNKSIVKSGGKAIRIISKKEYLKEK